MKQTHLALRVDAGFLSPSNINIHFLITILQASFPVVLVKRKRSFTPREHCLGDHYFYSHDLIAILCSNILKRS